MAFCFLGSIGIGQAVHHIFPAFEFNVYLLDGRNQMSDEFVNWREDF